VLSTYLCEKLQFVYSLKIFILFVNLFVSQLVCSKEQIALYFRTNLFQPTATTGTHNHWSNEQVKKLVTHALLVPPAATIFYVDEWIFYVWFSKSCCLSQIHLLTCSCNRFNLFFTTDVFKKSCTWVDIETKEQWNALIKLHEHMLGRNKLKIHNVLVNGDKITCTYGYLIKFVNFFKQALWNKQLGS